MERQPVIRSLAFAIPAFLAGWLFSLAFPPSNFSVFWKPIVELRTDIQLPRDNLSSSPTHDFYLSGTLQKGSRCELEGDKGAVVYLRCRLMLRESAIREARGA